ncbi:MAG: tetratricopeptide repeat protein [Betaproteobacteria bacterium]
MKPRITTVLIFVLSLLVAGAASAQDWRGVGRISGKVTDEAGQPLEGVVVTAHLMGSEGGPKVKTNKKGEWAINGINGGQWDLDFEKDGYEVAKKSASIQEHTLMPPMTVAMKKAAVDPNVAIRADLEKAAELIKEQKFAEARAIYQDILAKHPDAYQVEPYIARTYYAEHNLDAAAEHLRASLAKEPDNIQVKTLLAQVLAEKGDAEGSQQIIASIDESKITNPDTLLNVGIGMLNAKKPADAMTWFDKTIARFPQYPDAYYYRGITQLQEGRNDAAKADLAKYLELAPDGAEAATAKQILEKLK